MANENAAAEDGLTFGELLENRRSIRRYQDRPVSVQVGSHRGQDEIKSFYLG